jgi:hypothetical protein
LPRAGGADLLGRLLVLEGPTNPVKLTADGWILTTCSPEGDPVRLQIAPCLPGI